MEKSYFHVLHFYFCKTEQWAIISDNTTLQLLLFFTLLQCFPYSNYNYMVVTWEQNKRIKKILQPPTYSLKFNFWREAGISVLILHGFKVFLEFLNLLTLKHVKQLLRFGWWYHEDWLFSWDCWPTNSWKLYSQKRPSSLHHCNFPTLREGKQSKITEAAITTSWRHKSYIIIYIVY